MKDLLRIVPEIFHQQLRKSRYYAPKSETLVIQADGSRKQSDNADQCFEILRDVILDIGKRVVKGETSPEQKARVKSLYMKCSPSWRYGRHVLIYSIPGKNLVMKHDFEVKNRTVRRKAVEDQASALRIAKTSNDLRPHFGGSESEVHEATNVTLKFGTDSPYLRSLFHEGQ